MDQDTRKIEILKLVHSHFLADLNSFWVRHNFFIIANAGLLGFISSEYLASQITIFKQAIPFVGLAISILWLLISIVSTKWIGVWKEKVSEIDKDIDPYKAFYRGEELDKATFKVYTYFRPERVGICVPILFVFVWAAALIVGHNNPMQPTC